MVLTGIMFIILGIAILIFSLLSDKLTENGKIFWHWVSGFTICYGLFGILPPIKFPKNTDINVQTKQVPEVKKEILDYCDDIMDTDDLINPVFDMDDINSIFENNILLEN